MVKVAAVQLEAVLADVDANLAACERLATQAGEQGAEVIALPEFFTTGIGFDERLTSATLPVNGAAAELLTSLGGTTRTCRPCGRTPSTSAARTTACSTPGRTRSAWRCAGSSCARAPRAACADTSTW